MEVVHQPCVEMKHTLPHLTETVVMLHCFDWSVYFLSGHMTDPLVLLVVQMVSQFLCGPPDRHVTPPSLLPLKQEVLAAQLSASGTRN